MVRDWLMLLTPVAGLLENPVAPPVCAVVKVTLENCGEKTSTTLAPVTVVDPALVTTMVYVSVPPAATLVAPSVLVICKSVVAGVIATVFTSVATLFVALTSTTPAGVETLAVFVIAPAAVALTVPVTVYVIVDPTGRLTV